MSAPCTDRRGGTDVVRLAIGVLGCAMVLVAVLYELPPFTISYTSLAWHMLVSVGVGLLGIEAALRARRWWMMPALVLGFGVFLGLWCARVGRARPVGVRRGARSTHRMARGLGT